MLHTYTARNINLRYALIFSTLFGAFCFTFFEPSFFVVDAVMHDKLRPFQHASEVHG